ncbi:MAG: amino acid ABC transporter permease [Defluviitaleaceae bacterium]|nr:amino acid ABC transporter permease [Defluviitaleaceae bacterium]
MGLSFLSTPPPGWEEGFLFDVYRGLIRGNGWVSLLEGLGITMQIALGAVVIGVALGFALSLMRISKSKILKGVAAVYLSVIRGTPVVLQLFIWWFVVFAATGTTRLWVAIIAFGINSAAYVCEIFRGGIMSVDKGQTEAGRSLGLSGIKTMMFVVLPQALKNALPSLGNEFIMLIKETSVVGFIALVDLMRAANLIMSGTFEPVVPLFSAGILYWIVITILTQLLTLLERRLRRSDNR